MLAKGNINVSYKPSVMLLIYTVKSGNTHRHIDISANIPSLVLAFQYNVVGLNSYMDPRLLSAMMQSYKCFSTGKMLPSHSLLSYLIQRRCSWSKMIKPGKFDFSIVNNWIDFCLTLNENYFNYIYGWDVYKSKDGQFNLVTATTNDHW